MAVVIIYPQGFDSPEVRQKKKQNQFMFDYIKEHVMKHYIDKLLNDMGIKLRRRTYPAVTHLNLVIRFSCLKPTPLSVRRKKAFQKTIPSLKHIMGTFFNQHVHIIEFEFVKAVERIVGFNTHDGEFLSYEKLLKEQDYINAVDVYA